MSSWPLWLIVDWALETAVLSRPLEIEDGLRPSNGRARDASVVEALAVLLLVHSCWRRLDCHVAQRDSRHPRSVRTRGEDAHRGRRADLLKYRLVYRRPSDNRAPARPVRGN